MARLTYRKRKRLRRGTFAVPKGRKYPIPDLAHARNALARVSANGTATEKRQVARAVRRKFPSLARRSKFVKRYA